MQSFLFVHKFIILYDTGMKAVFLCGLTTSSVTRPYVHISHNFVVWIMAFSDHLPLQERNEPEKPAREHASS